MIIARDIMTTKVVTLTPEMDFVAAARLLLEKRVNGAPVIDEQNRLVGILCQSDLIAQQKRIPVPTLLTVLDSYIQFPSARQIEKQVRKIAALTVEEAMTPDPVTVQPDTQIETVAALMVDSNLHTLPVIEKGEIVGIIGKEDVLRTLLPQKQSH
jgi:CBS-domain-containing membrane protein